MKVAVGLAALALVTGCGGSSGAASELSAIDEADLRASLAERPPGDGGLWSPDTPGLPNPQSPTSTSLSDAETSLLERLSGAGLRHLYVSAWARNAGDAGGMSAAATGFLFNDRHGALSAAPLIRAHDRDHTEDIRPLDVGDSGWGYHRGGSDAAYEYGFVLGNAVIAISILCWHGACLDGEQVIESAEQYAEAIEATATARS